MAQINLPDVIPTGTKIAVSQALLQAVEIIAATLSPDKIVLFGSYGHGRPTPDSDIDLLVILETDLPPVERSWAVLRLLLPRQFPVDILVKTPAEINRAIRTGEAFIQEILTRGVVLYERGQ